MENILTYFNVNGERYLIIESWWSKKFQAMRSSTAVLDGCPDQDWKPIEAERDTFDEAVADIEKFTSAKIF